MGITPNQVKHPRARPGAPAARWVAEHQEARRPMTAPWTKQIPRGWDVPRETIGKLGKSGFNMNLTNNNMGVKWDVHSRFMILKLVTITLITTVHGRYIAQAHGIVNKLASEGHHIAGLQVPKRS